MRKYIEYKNEISNTDLYDGLVGYGLFAEKNSIHLRDYTVLLFPRRNKTIPLRIWFSPNSIGMVNGKFSSGHITGFFVNMVLFHVLSYHHLYKSGIMGIAKHTIRGYAEKVFTGSYIRYIYADMGFIRFARLYDVR